jgi:hypothetical protein
MQEHDLDVSAYNSHKVKLRIGSTATYPLNIHIYIYTFIYLSTQDSLKFQ